jgi:hypothetical protein
MFGLTQREQRWDAQERGAKMLLDFKLAQLKELVKLEELKQENLRLQIKLKDKASGVS